MWYIVLDVEESWWKNEEVICKCSNERKNRGADQKDNAEDEKIVEVYEDESVEMIESYIEDNPPKTSNQAIWFLGESLKKLSQADLFVCINDTWEWDGCQIERDVAGRYGIKTYVVPAEYVIDNYKELICEKKGKRSSVEF